MVSFTKGTASPPAQESQEDEEPKSSDQCLACNKRRIEYQALCRHPSSCAMKQATGGKCKVCGERFFELQRVASRASERLLAVQQRSMATVAAAPARTRISAIFGGSLAGKSNQPPWSGKLRFPLFEHAPKIDVPSPIHAFPTPPQSPRTLPRSPSLSNGPPSAATAPDADESPAVLMIDRQKYAGRIEELAVQTGHELKELKEIRDTLLVDAQRQAAELEACVKTWHDCLHTVEKAGDDALDAAGIASFKRLETMIEWITTRPDALSTRDMLGQRAQHAFAKVFLAEKAKLVKDETRREQVVGDLVHSITSFEVARARAAVLCFRIDLLAQTVDEATLSAHHASDRVASIDKEIEQIKPYGASDKPRVSALGLLRRRVLQTKADKAAELQADGEREDAYIAFRAIRRTLETQCLAEMRQHDITERTFFDPSSAGTGQPTPIKKRFTRRARPAETMPEIPEFILPSETGDKISV